MEWSDRDINRRDPDDLTETARVVARSYYEQFPKLFVAILLGAIGLTLHAPTATAGCHVADRPPTLGLLLQQLDDATTSDAIAADLSATHSAVVPMPCADPTASETATTVPTAGPCALATDRLGDDLGSSRLVPPSDPAATGFGPARRLDRPPRIVAIG